MCVCSTGNEDERAVVGPTEEELKDECTGRSGGGKMRIVPACAKGLPSRLSETNDDNIVGLVSFRARCRPFNKRITLSNETFRFPRPGSRPVLCTPKWAYEEHFQALRDAIKIKGEELVPLHLHDLFDVCGFEGFLTTIASRDSALL